MVGLAPAIAPRPVRPGLRSADLAAFVELSAAVRPPQPAGMVGHCCGMLAPARQSRPRPAAHDRQAGRAAADGRDSSHPAAETAHRARRAVLGGIGPGPVRAARRGGPDPRRRRSERARRRCGTRGCCRRYAVSAASGRGRAGVTRRLLQAMAGARHGGAEIFFVRLADALQRAGETQRVLVRPDPDRSRTLQEAGVPLAELRFGSLFDIATRTAFRREIAAWRPDIVLTWMSRATAMCPAGDFVHVGRLGGYYDLQYYRRCQHLIGNTRAIVDYAVSQGWPRERAHYPLGNGVIEAGAAGLPVVATAGDGPAALIENGSSGLLVPLPDEPSDGAVALADAMQQIAGDAALRARLAQGGRAAYEASFTEAAVVGRYRAFFDQVAG